jgi:putative addiction module component (TIGR02574 family)
MTVFASRSEWGAGRRARLLVEDLWDSVAAHPEQVETALEQFAEFERRLTELDANPEGGESWDEAKARILDSL